MTGNKWIASKGGIKEGEGESDVGATKGLLTS